MMPGLLPPNLQPGEQQLTAVPTSIVRTVRITLALLLAGIYTLFGYAIWVVHTSGNEEQKVLDAIKKQATQQAGINEGHRESALRQHCAAAEILAFQSGGVSDAERKLLAIVCQHHDAVDVDPGD